MVREIVLEEIPLSSQPSFGEHSTPPPEDAPADVQIEMPPREVIEEQAKELERMTPSRPDMLQSSLMEFIFLWVTPFPDDLWLKMIATVMLWCAVRPRVLLRVCSRHSLFPCIQAVVTDRQVVLLPAQHRSARSERETGAPSVPDATRDPPYRDRWTHGRGSLRRGRERHSMDGRVLLPAGDNSVEQDQGEVEHAL